MRWGIDNTVAGMGFLLPDMKVYDSPRAESKNHRRVNVIELLKK